VLDVRSRRVLGWSLGDRCRTQLVADALDLALWRRQGPDGCINNPTTAATRSAFGHRGREAVVRGSMRTDGDAYDNAWPRATLNTRQLERRP
jgi:putative transposase